jgi:hypothetical protein
MSAPAGHGQAAAAIHVSSTEGLALAAAVALVILAAYLFSLWRNPMTMCRRCGGNGTVGGWFFAYGRNWCPKCGGHKLVPRLGTRVMDLLGGPARPQHR